VTTHNPDAPQNGSIQRPMTPEELVANGYPADFHTNFAARQEWLKLQAARVRHEEPLLPGNVNQGQHVKQARDKAQYVRQQQGHSLIKHLFLGVFVLWIPAIYYTFSPNHYWHA
jgi:hypothetical protein